MKKYFVLLSVVFLFIFTQGGFSQLYQGPATGSVENGITVSTDNFVSLYEPNPLPPTVQRPLRNKIPFEKYPDGMNRTPASAPEGKLFCRPVCWNSFKDPGA